MRPEEVWPYVAGLIEGEGWIGTSRNSSTSIRRLGRVDVSMTDMDVVMRLPELTGLGVATKVGRPTKGGKDVYRWVVRNRDEVVTLLRRIMPYLGARRWQSAVDVLEYMGDSAHRLRDLRERGAREAWKDYLPA